MKIQSCKAKGRCHQQKIVSDLYEAFPELGDGDLRSTSMGANGEDIQMSAAARKKIPFSIEAKNTERLNVWNAFDQCKANCANFEPALVIKKNHSDILCVVRWEAFLSLLKTNTNANENVSCGGGSDPSSLPLHEQLRSIANALEKQEAEHESKKRKVEEAEAKDAYAPGGSIFESS